MVDFTRDNIVFKQVHQTQNKLDFKKKNEANRSVLIKQSKLCTFILCEYRDQTPLAKLQFYTQQREVARGQNCQPVNYSKRQ